MKINPLVTNSKAIKRFKTLEKDFNKIHNNKYNYDKFIYKNTEYKSIIICKLHGEFKQTAHNHLKGEGCPKCANEINGRNNKKSTETYIEEANIKHNYKYLYNNTVYTGKENKIIITCPIHRDFLQRASDHLQKGHGCPKCGKCYKRSTEELIADFKAVHNNDYNYSEIKFTSMRNKIKIKCNKCNNYFLQIPHHHIRGVGCPFCAKKGFNKNKKGILYYLKILHNEKYYYKIGITNYTVKKRYKRYESDINKIIDYIEFSMKSGFCCYNEEQYWIKKYKDKLYKGNETILKSAIGNTELFTEDVLKLFI